MYSGAATPCTERIVQNNGVDGRSGQFYVHGNKKPSTHREGKNMKNEYTVEQSGEAMRKSWQRLMKRQLRNRDNLGVNTFVKRG